MSLWLKFWCDALDDPKLMRAARKGATQLKLLPWILLFAKRAEDDGRLTVNGEAAEAEDIARSLPAVAAAEVATALTELEQIGVLVRGEDDVLTFAAWEARAASPPSDSREAVRERVRDYRKRQRVLRAEQGAGNRETPRNALRHVTGSADVTKQSGERERRAERKSESQSGDGEREVGATASFTPAQQLPPAAVELLGHIQSEKQSRVTQEMRLVLNGGCTFRNQRICASAARLEAKCRESLVAVAGGRIRNPGTKAWAFTLAKLADTSDGSAPGAIGAAEERIDAVHDVTEQGEADAWIATVPSIAAEIEARLDREGFAKKGPAATSRRIARKSLVLAAWRGKVP